MAFVPSIVRPIPTAPVLQPRICPARPRLRLGPVIPVTSTARPLRASTVASVLPVIASHRQLYAHLGSASALLDRVFISLLLLLLLHLFPLFPTPFSALLRILLVAFPVILPWFRATRANAALRRRGAFLLLSGPLTATRAAHDRMNVELSCAQSGLVAKKVVPLRKNLLGKRVLAHALCAVKGDSVNVIEVVADGMRLVGCQELREPALKRICDAASGSR